MLVIPSTTSDRFHVYLGDMMETSDGRIVGSLSDNIGQRGHFEFRDVEHFLDHVGRPTVDVSEDVAEDIWGDAPWTHAILTTDQWLSTRVVEKAKLYQQGLDSDSARVRAEAEELLRQHPTWDTREIARKDPTWDAVAYAKSHFAGLQAPPEDEVCEAILAILAGEKTPLVGPLTPKEFRAARRELGLSAVQLGLILDTSPTTIRKWEGEGSTARAPNPVACRVMRWMLAGWRPPEWPERVARPKPGA